MSIITLDFETFWSREYSLSKMPVEAYVRDPRFEIIGVSVKVDSEPPQWYSGTMEQIAAWLDRFNIPGNFLLCHHTQFDGFILSYHFGIKARFYFDTMSMARPLHGQTIGVGLAALSEKYTIGIKGDEVLWSIGKHRVDFTPAELARYGSYCCNDAQLTYMLFRILRKQIPINEIRIIDNFIRMFVDPVFEINVDLLNDHLDEVRQKKAALLASAGELVDKKTLMSNVKFAEFLRSLGVTPPMKVSARTGKMTFAFAKNDLGFQHLLEHEDPVVQAAVAARLGMKSTLEETRTEALIGIAGRGRLPVYLNYYGAHGTGRASGGGGINPQNLTRKSALRRSLKAPEGHEVVVGDSAQIEARVTAWLADQKDLVEDFRNGVDVYSQFASEIYGRPINRKRKEIGPDGVEFEPEFLEGFVGKTGILGLGFGVSGPKLQLTLKTGKPSVDLGLKMACDIVRLYRTKYRRIPKLWDCGTRALYAIVKGEEYRFGVNGLIRANAEGIHLPNGMIIRYPGLTLINNDFYYAKTPREQVELVRRTLTATPNPEKLTHIYGAKVIENVVQALARIIVFDQLLAVAGKYRVVLTVHDEIVACILQNKTLEAVQFVTTIMNTAPSWAATLPVACEVHHGKTYGDAK